MRFTTPILSLAVALSLTLAGCNRNTERTPTPKTSSVEPGGVQQPRTAPATTSQPATTGAPSQQSGAGGPSTAGGGASAESKTPTTIDGQVDAGHGAQHKDFQHPETGGK
jgi:hypothetical protein